MKSSERESCEESYYKFLRTHEKSNRLQQYILSFCRLVSLEEGEGDLPCSLILVHQCQQSGETQVVGHVRLAAAAVRPKGVLLEACELVAQPYYCLSVQSTCN